MLENCIENVKADENCIANITFEDEALTDFDNLDGCFVLRSCSDAFFIQCLRVRPFWAVVLTTRTT
jgi:hypothetical protein